MKFVHLYFLSCMFHFFSCDQAIEFDHGFVTKSLKSINADSVKTNNPEPETSQIIFQSKDGGQTWDDISQSLPENAQPEGFFTGEKELYLRVKNSMYRSKNDSKLPVWEKEFSLDKRCTAIAFNRSGVMAFNYEGQIYQKINSMGTWLPVYSNFKKQLLRTIFETSDGTLFVGCDSGLFRSVDNGQNWRQVRNEGWVMKLVESDGVLLATGQKGIMRSTDKGENWDWVISEGGVGIDVAHIDGGFAAISYNTMTKSRRVRISMDKGKTWKTIDAGLQPSDAVSSISQLGKYLICGHPDGIFRSSDMGKTWNIAMPSIGKKVFSIYVAGNTLYAVPRNAGC
jgi:photosystem II stability/assembly factor-like uncharacterized protein